MANWKTEDSVPNDNKHFLTRKITFLCILIFIFLDGKLEDRRFCSKW